MFHLSVCFYVLREAAEARWHANCLSSNTASMLQSLVMVLYSLTVYDTMLCAFDCGGMVSGGHEVSAYVSGRIRTVFLNIFMNPIRNTAGENSR